MGVGILAKRVVLELGFSTNFVYSLSRGFDSLDFLTARAGSVLIMPPGKDLF